MRGIVKGQPPTNVAPQPPPVSWLQAAAKLKQELPQAPAPIPATFARGRYEELDKAAIRSSLCAEQANLCVFCERRVSPAFGPAGEPALGVRIAHWKPISVNPIGALDWRNVYASCTGLWPSGAKTCDEKQSSTDPQLDPPSDRDWSTLLEFGSGGTVEARPGAPAALSEAIGENVWNLNHKSLVAARAARIQQIVEMARQERNSRPYPPKAKVVDRHLARLTPQAGPYVTAARQALERWR